MREGFSLTVQLVSIEMLGPRICLAASLVIALKLLVQALPTSPSLSARVIGIGVLLGRQRVPDLPILNPIVVPTSPSTTRSLLDRWRTNAGGRRGPEVF